MKPMFFGMMAAAILSSAAPAIAQTVQPEPDSLRAASTLPPLELNGTTGSTTPQTDGGPVTRAPAPPLTYVGVYAVGSTQYGGFEYPAQGAFSTTGDHGGAELVVVVQEMGYGQNRIARLNGSVLPSPANYQSQPICGTLSAPTLSCPAGSTIIGFMQYYDLSGNQSGAFSFQSTSINSPFNTLSTSINIR